MSEDRNGKEGRKGRWVNSRQKKWRREKQREYINLREINFQHPYLCLGVKSGRKELRRRKTKKILRKVTKLMRIRTKGRSGSILCPFLCLGVEPGRRRREKAKTAPLFRQSVTVLKFSVTFYSAE